MKKLEIEYYRNLDIRKNEWKANHNSLTYVKTSKLLTDLKKREDASWLKDTDSIALQQSLRDLDRAYENFFKKRAGYLQKLKILASGGGFVLNVEHTMIGILTPQRIFCVKH